MEAAVTIARIFGPFLLVVGLALLIHPKLVERMGKEVKSMPNFMALFEGSVALIVGLVIVNFYNVWDVTWMVLVPIIGWLCVIKGVLLLLFPEILTYKGFYNAYVSVVSGIIFIILGAVLTYGGFYLG